jgi:hypothetical protein
VDVAEEVDVPLVHLRDIDRQLGPRTGVLYRAEQRRCDLAFDPYDLARQRAHNHLDSNVLPNAGQVELGPAIQQDRELLELAGRCAPPLEAGSGQEPPRIEFGDECISPAPPLIPGQPTAHALDGVPGSDLRADGRVERVYRRDRDGLGLDGIHRADAATSPEAQSHTEGQHQAVASHRTHRRVLPSPFPSPGYRTSRAHLA